MNESVEPEDEDVCEYCEGEGVVVICSDDEFCPCCGAEIADSDVEMQCPRCNGTGTKVEPAGRAKT